MARAMRRRHPRGARLRATSSRGTCIVTSLYLVIDARPRGLPTRVPRHRVLDHRVGLGNPDRSDGDTISRSGRSRSARADGSRNADHGPSSPPALPAPGAGADVVGVRGGRLEAAPMSPGSPTNWTTRCGSTRCSRHGRAGNSSARRPAWSGSGRWLGAPASARRSLRPAQ